MAPSAPSAENMRAQSEVHSSKVYVTASDLQVRQAWAACTLGFAYRLDPARLRSALQSLVDQFYPVLASRLQQDRGGRYFLDESNTGFTFSVQENAGRHLGDVLKAFVVPPTPEVQLTTRLAADFVEQLDIVGYLADAEGAGQVVFDLAALYQGKPVSARSSSRLGMQALKLRAGGQDAASNPSDEELIQTLPKMPPPPASFEEIVATGRFDVLGTTKAERAAGCLLSQQVLHLPGSALTRLRKDILSSPAVKQQGINNLTVHDIMAATLWIAREAAEGNDLTNGLKRCLCYAVDLRRASANTADAALKVPTDFWGNAVTPNIVMPPPAPATDGSLPQADRVKSILAAAACAIHAGTQSLRQDPTFIPNALALAASMEDSDFWKTLLATPGFVPFRDCAAMVSSWRAGTMDRTDFGQGKPWIVVGKVLPLSQSLSILTQGPGGDGALFTWAYKDDGHERLFNSTLELIDPDIVLM